MKTLYRCVSVAVLIAAGFSAVGQNLDPTVVVDRAYEGKLMEVHKPLLEMAVPDTVMRFDLDFDYSVFENPYKGSYEFNPYLLSMKPSAASDVAGKFYLRAGAGYQLRPELDMVWSPVIKGEDSPLQVDVYARHRSYVGNYHELSESAGYKYNGVFMNTKAGVSMGYDMEKASLLLDAGYYGRQRFKDGDPARNYNAFETDFSIGSRKNMTSEGLVFGADVSYRLASDKMPDKKEQILSLTENNLDVDIAFGASLKDAGRFRVDMSFERDGYAGALEGSASIVSVTPHYIYENGSLYADLGLNISKVAADTTSGLFFCSGKEQIIYPDITVRLSLVPDALMLFAKAGGGNRIYSNSYLLERNMFLDILNGGREVLGLHLGSDMGIGIERISAVAGLEGRFGSRFSWNLHAGYSDYASGIVDSGFSTGLVVSGVDYAPYSTWNGTFSWLWKSESFMADGSLTYRNAWGDAFASGLYNFKPAALVGDVSFEYNYNRRIYAGLSCDFSSERQCSSGSYSVPGYADLGISAEYVTSRALSFWIKGGNLLGMTIQRNPFYAIKGPYFTAGICLNL